MWFWSGLPESSTLNSALMRNLPFQAALSSLATDGSFGGVELAQITLSIRPCCSMACSSGTTVGPVKSSTTPPPSPASCTRRWARPAGSVIGTSSRMLSPSMPFCLAKSTTPLLIDVEAGLVRRDDDELALGPGPHGGLGAAEARVVRAHVHGREVRAREAGLVDAGDDQVEALLGVVVLVDAAVDDARVADEAEHPVLLDELRGQRRDLLRVDLLGLGDVLDRPAVDAAVVVHAVEVGLRHAR